MNTKRRLRIAGLALTLLFTIACGAAPTVLQAPSTPTPGPGMGVPHGSGGWQISLQTVRTADSLQMGSYPNQTTFTPKDGYAFLIIDVIIRSLDPTRAMSISTDNVAILDTDKTIHTADGGGWGEGSICAGCRISFSREVGASEISGFALVTSGGTYTMHFTTLSTEQPVSFLFIVQEQELDQDWQLQFQDVPTMSFKVGDQAVYPLTTEVVAQNSPLPQECRADTIKSVQTKASLVYQEWADNKLTTRSVRPNGGAPVELCAGFAYSSIQTAPDGGLLLKAGPAQGWMTLYIIEPGGKVKSLVRNAHSVSADFVPGTKFAVVSVSQIGKEGKEIYLYDREKGVMTLLYEGQWLKYRTFTNGNLLVNGRTSESTDSIEAMGPAGTDKLPALELPEGTSSSDITPDGEHLVYTSYDGGTSQLFVSNLDGSDKKKVMSGDIAYGDRTLSPDARYLLVQAKGTAENTNQASLYDLASGSAQPITPDGNSVKYSFSSDGKWVVAINTWQRAENDKAKTQKQTLYLFSLDKNKVLKEIKGEIVNYFFSPENTFLAYTLKNEDETLNMFVIDLANLKEQPLGNGILTGWSPGK